MNFAPCYAGVISPICSHQTVGRKGRSAGDISLNGWMGKNIDPEAIKLVYSLYIMEMRVCS